MNEGLVVVVRSIISFFTLLIFARFLGKQQIGQLTFFDYTLGITIGSIAGSLSTDLNSRAWPYWAGLFSWAILGLTMQKVTLKWSYASKYIEDQPTIVIMNGKILEDSLKKTRFRISDILGFLRNKNIFDISQVDFAIIETNGQLSVQKKPQYETLTAKDMNISKKPTGISTELIYEGKIVEENLVELNITQDWLIDQLRKQDIYDISNVFFAELNPSGSLYIDKYEDRIKKILDIGDYKGPY